VAHPRLTEKPRQDEMSKLNRIGNKLGIAGAIGILLAVGMVANQVATESTVAAANTRADRSQRIVESTVGGASQHEASPARRPRDQVGQNCRRSSKGYGGTAPLRELEAKELDTALAIAQKPETRERLQRIKELTRDYAAGTKELAKAQGDLLAQIEKRTAISTEWTKAFATELASPALARLANRPDIEKLLYQADSSVNAIRAAVWRYGVTGEADIPGRIATIEGTLKQILKSTRDQVEDKEFRGGSMRWNPSSRGSLPPMATS
jgi:predicted negative regulator of RcsB-dependent stress response